MGIPATPASAFVRKVRCRREGVEVEHAPAFESKRRSPGLSACTERLMAHPPLLAADPDAP